MTEERIERRLPKKVEIKISYICPVCGKEIIEEGDLRSDFWIEIDHPYKESIPEDVFLNRARLYTQCSNCSSRIPLVDTADESHLYLNEDGETEFDIDGKKIK